MKLWGLACLVALVVVVSAKTTWEDLDDYTFADYVKEFHKSYPPEEYAYRKALFEEKLEEIITHNAQDFSWKKGVNQFTDKTFLEFSVVLGYNYKSADPSLGIQAKLQKDYHLDSLPGAVDWREKNIISAVKNQGECGSCWTFGTAETVESYWANKTGQLTDLSEQQILDCTPNPNDCGGTGGCEGGTAEIAYKKIMEIGGLSSEWTYPYVSFHGQNYKCHFSSNTPAFAKLKNFVKLPSNEYAPVLHHIATTGPLAINVDASSWSDYESGVYDSCNMNSPDLDHVVQLVGYGTSSEGDYWLVRNSWSPSWGEKGYIRIKRSATPECGIDQTPQDGTGCNGGPSTVKVCGMCGILYATTYPIVA